MPPHPLRPFATPPLPDFDHQNVSCPISTITDPPGLRLWPPLSLIPTHFFPFTFVLLGFRTWPDALIFHHSCLGPPAVSPKRGRNKPPLPPPPPPIPDGALLRKLNDTPFPPSLFLTFSRFFSDHTLLSFRTGLYDYTAAFLPTAGVEYGTQSRASLYRSGSARPPSPHLPRAPSSSFPKISNWKRKRKKRTQSWQLPPWTTQTQLF